MQCLPGSRFNSTDANCSAVLLPKEGVLMPNDGAAEEGSWRLVRKEHW